MINYVRVLSILVLILGIHTTVVGQQSGVCPEPIIYRVFDSLEQHLCKQMNRLRADGYDSVYVVIGPAINESKQSSIFRYEVSLQEYTKADLLYNASIASCIISKSNRYLSICGKLCPVYFRWIDQLFVLENPNEPYGGKKNRGLPVIPIMPKGPRDVDFANKVIAP